MTQILALPSLSGSMTIVTNADFLQAWGFTVAGSSPATPIDLTGIDFRMQVRAAADPTVIGLDLGLANGGLISGGAAGTLTVWSPRAANAALAPGDWLADLLAEGDGLTINLFSGGPMTVTVIRGITT